MSESVLSFTSQLELHLPATVQVGPSVGFSLIMVRLVSRETRTVESKGIWKAVRRYCVRTIGRSCFVSICCWISPNSRLKFSISPGVLPCTQRRQLHDRPEPLHTQECNALRLFLPSLPCKAVT